MATEKQLQKSAQIAEHFLTLAAKDNKYSKRITEQIIRSEAGELKKKFDRITLSVIISLIVIGCVLIILQIQLTIFSNEIIIPILMIIILVIISVIFAVEYFYIKKQGSIRLQKRLETENKLQLELKEFQRSYTPTYNFVKFAFDSVVNMDSRYLLNGFILKYLFKLSRIEKENLSEEVLYRCLFMITSKKNFDVIVLLEEYKAKEDYLSAIRNYLDELLIILDEFLKAETLPIYFRELISKIKEKINSYKSPDTKK
ncbi:MAG: hypothetical protein FK734_05595 [Asgard group archaeon]|nr:hypothetical protein [Asgard group archaeon]